MAENNQSGIGFKPLYLQVREKLALDLSSGRWQPGSRLPSEIELAAELGVSQGTVRKAIDSLAVEKILERHQGRGTYVAAYEDSRILFQFFRLHPNEGERLFPVSEIISRSSGYANPDEAEALGLKRKSKVWRVERVRYHGEQPILREIISLSAERFPEFDKLKEIENNVYQLYSRHWNATITSTAEKLTAVPASLEDASALFCPPEAPLLRVERTAFDINRSPVEYRVSHCLTKSMHYRFP